MVIKFIFKHTHTHSVSAVNTLWDNQKTHLFTIGTAGDIESSPSRVLKFVESRGVRQCLNFLEHMDPQKFCHDKVLHPDYCLLNEEILSDYCLLNEEKSDDDYRLDADFMVSANTDPLQACYST